MDTSSFQKRLLRRTAETLTRLSRAQAGFEERRTKPPRPGDLFVFPVTADFDLQWAVLDRHPREAHRLLVVPADVNPQVGSADVAVSANAPYGAMTLRCQYGVWLREEVFDAEMRTGFLPNEDLRRAQRKRAEIDRGTVRASPAARRTDVEADYRSLTAEVLVRAQHVLGELGGLVD